TLIEEDKRDDLHVTLPYSKETFSVPNNLYIIATMNSTDKSIALIDIALRRRFTFLKMEPDSSLVNRESKEVFEKLNAFITQKLGKDFQIGHSYFMNYDDLGFVLKYKIKPLLEEYFFADENALEEAKKILSEAMQDE
ncbi:MAG: ATPase, partial [Campylobacterota bacterium]|nr:ATPase [Campylobacterota bacterium]